MPLKSFEVAFGSVFFHSAVEVLLVESLATIATVQVFQSVQSQYLEVTERLVAFQVKKFIASHLQHLLQSD